MKHLGPIYKPNNIRLQFAFNCKIAKFMHYFFSNLEAQSPATYKPNFTYLHMLNLRLISNSIWCRLKLVIHFVDHMVDFVQWYLQY